MSQIDDERNFPVASTTGSVDEINRSFYERFQFPYPPAAFHAPLDPAFETIMLNQSIGGWDHSLIPQTARVWVAGCGTNQAVFTGLRFPHARIVASDLSSQSLVTAQRSAESLGVRNVEFQNQSINLARFHEEFDFIICTGVIHHNADPQIPLSRLAAALRPTGFLELMVYNRYHRISTTAFQKAIRLLCSGANFEDELHIAQAVVRSLRTDSSMGRLGAQKLQASESEFADAILQPVEHSFTVESLEELLAGCGLQLITPCISQYDKASGNFDWNMEFADAELSACYQSLPDLQRWKISNHLLLERSPHLWFYAARRDSGFERRSEAVLCQEFLKRRFLPGKTQKQVYLRDSDGLYKSRPKLFDHPGTHPNSVCRRVIETVAAEPRLHMAEVLSKLGLSHDFPAVNKLRLGLTTSSFPFLTARAG